MNPMSKLTNQLTRAFKGQMSSVNTNYIYVPHMQLFIIALRITLIMFFLYLLSAKLLIIATLTPVYFIVIYLYYLLWLKIKRYNFRLFPYILCLILLNVPFFFIAVYIRELILNLF